MRRLSVICVVLLSVCLVSVCMMPVDGQARFAMTARAVQKPFRPYGYFSLVGTHPKGFESFDTIQYWRKEDEQSGPDISERLSGVNERGGTRYRYATISINRQRFVFTTVKVRGTSYSFAGRFLRTDFVNEMDFDKPVLAGRLVKYRDGKKVAEASIRLSYFAGT